METPTPRETRHKLNRMEAWCARNAAALGSRAVFLRSLFEVAVTAAEADYIEAELRTLTARPEAAPEPSAHA